jgi:hypothetical protein
MELIKLSVMDQMKIAYLIPPCQNVLQDLKGALRDLPRTQTNDVTLNMKLDVLKDIIHTKMMKVENASLMIYHVTTDILLILTIQNVNA